MWLAKSEAVASREEFIPHRCSGPSEIVNTFSVKNVDSLGCVSYQKLELENDTVFSESIIDS